MRLKQDKKLKYRQQNNIFKKNIAIGWQQFITVIKNIKFFFVRMVFLFLLFKKLFKKTIILFLTLILIFNGWFINLQNFKHSLQIKKAQAATIADFKIQRGCETPSSGTRNVTLTAGTDYTAPGSNSSAFIRMISTRLSGNGDTVGGGSQEADDFTWYISDPDFSGGSVTFTRAGSTNPQRFCWEIIEYIGSSGGNNEMIVREVGTATYGSSSKTVSGSSVTVNDDNDVVVFITGQNSVETSSQQQVNAGQSTAEWISSTDTPTFTRGVTGSDANSLSYAVVEFTGSHWNVQRVEHTFSAVGATETESITDVGSVSRAFFHEQYRVDANEGLDDSGAKSWISATNETSFYLNSGADAAASAHHVVLWVVSNIDTSVNTRMNVQHVSGTRVSSDTSEGSNNEEDEWTQTITEVSDMSQTSIMGETNESSGSGTYFPRGWIVLYLNSTTGVKMWQSDDGQPQNYYFQVVEWPKIEVDPSTNQLHFRWRNDSTDLNTSGGWLAAEDSNSINKISKNKTYRLRVEIANTGGAAESSSRTYELQWGKKTSSNCSSVSSWVGIGDSTDEFSMVDSSNISPDGETTSSSLLANIENYTYTSGEGRDVSDTSSSIGPLTNNYYTELEYSFQANDSAVTDATYCFRVYDTSAGTALDGYSIYPEVTISSVSVKYTDMEWGKTDNVSDDAWTTINFTSKYEKPVFLCTLNYNNNIGKENDGDANSVVCRVRNVNSSSAQVRLQEPGYPGDLTENETVYWLVVEEGKYNTSNIKMEAFTHLSVVTDHKNSWTGEIQSYMQTYNTPVVLGQVMTYNDTDWSVFYARGSTTSSIPTSTSLFIGKHTGEENATRSNETLGVVVVEQGDGTLDGSDYEAFQTQNNPIDRIDDNTTNTINFSKSFTSPPIVGFVSQTGIRGGDGPHTELYGANPLTSTTIQPTIMEDEVVDNEQTGSTENLSYLVFSSPGVFSLKPLSLDQITYRWYDNADSVQPGSAKAAENTAITNVNPGDVLRLRTTIQVGSRNIPASGESFILQYGEGSNCSAISNWYNVDSIGGSGIWRGYDNSSPTDGSQITSSLLDNQTNTLGSYEEENSSASNHNTILKDSNGEWDWVIENNGAKRSTDYCFRIVTSAGEVFQYTNYPQLTTGSTGILSVNIVDDNDDYVTNPSVVMGAVNFSFKYQTSTGTFSTATEKIRINNNTGNPQWNLTVAADNGSTSLWQGATASYDFNDPTANANDGPDSDSFGGQMTIDASSGTISGTCGTTGITKGSSASFSEGVNDSITILSAGSNANTDCYIDLTGINVSQTIPSEQAIANDYSINMTLTITAI